MPAAAPGPSRVVVSGRATGAAVPSVRLDVGQPVGWAAPAVAIGNFDGVHRGHQELVAVTREQAISRSGTAAALTFEPHPARVLTPDRAPAALCTPAQKLELLGALGLDRVGILPFTPEVAGLSAEDFVSRFLAGLLAARVVVVGEGFRFGRGRGGDLQTLRDVGARMGFEVVAVPPVMHGGAPISSSRVREALGRGDVDEARALLGRAYSVDGRVVRGEGRGRSLGIPTANLDCENEILPAAGVYAGTCRLASGDVVSAVINRGHRPTFGAGAETLEAHLLDFDGDLYETELRVTFEARLRGERRFEGPEALVAQIREDKRRAEGILASRRGNGV